MAMDQPEENSKLTTEEFIELMKDHGISFEGRIQPEKWGEYTAIFEEIRRIGKMGSKEFTDMFHPQDKYAVDKAYKAVELSEKAWNCLESRDSEQGWRKEVEYRAFECFDSEVICRICRKRPWKPMFEAKPADPADVERLQRRRQKRVLCGCTRLEQTQTKVNDQYSRLFYRELDKHIDHEDMTDSVKRRLKGQRPDRVIGLRPTGTLRHHLPSLQAKYCPFKKANVVFPFIVIEAKAAENTAASFPSMLRQTAFVIRTCLRLQQNLRRETRMPHQCLVWSFLIMGEEWRLYAAVPDGSDVQIFDLWHGTVLFPEGALQLLLIIEHLCDWACEVYRMSVLTCLAGGRDNLLSSRLSPSGTDMSSQHGDTELTALRAISLPSRSSLMRELPNGDIAGLPKDNSPGPLEFDPLLQIDSIASPHGQDSHHWRRWVTNEQDLSFWTGKATIRHSNQVQLSFVQVAMPTEVLLLNACLASCFPYLRPKEAARRLLVSLQDDDLAVTASMEATSRQGYQFHNSTLDVRALIYFRSALNPEDWGIARHVLAILCDQEALRALAEIAELNPHIHPTSERCDRPDCERFKQAIDWVKAVGGTKSAGLALARRQLCLRSVSDKDGSFMKLEWTKFCPQSDDGLSGEDLLGIMSHISESPEAAVPALLAPYIKKHRCTYTVQVGSDQGPTPTVLEIPNLLTSGALIKKPTTGWPETTQDFCFLVTNETVRFDDVAQLGHLLEESRRAKELYVIVRKKATYNQRDFALIDWWIRVLKNELPYDATFE
ncbi:uncharacterized protein A1O5_03602 [Cladophialophora psammophila CBS 110553]|uniref:Uncharacterized protein n=1 Tax=Cladophialophora psammophila CBS 110553 TaxID=1182543 RepID=W9X965_9EURO|nr:uncharacterized protein A1O5_03602 [Cladophialophora psammophila CBS 110553]EXJ73840.1 hypothetical protein A1O5_03602 [Cladophialophora psammophila CBS 110553]